MKREYGNCTCAPTELPFCDHWDCTTKRFDEYAECVVGRESIECVGISFTESLTCACTSRAPSQRYCSEWSCREDSSRIKLKKGDYQCLEEDVTGEYCYRRKGNISSSYAIASSVCECFARGELFCKHWECQERSMIRCAAHILGWCSVEIGVGVGGGCGLFFFLSVGCRIRNPPDNRLPNDGRRETHTFLCSCLPVSALHTNWIILRRFLFCKRLGMPREVHDSLLAAHYGGWCSIEIAIGVGGGCGLFFFLSVGCRSKWT